MRGLKGGKFGCNPPPPCYIEDCRVLTLSLYLVGVAAAVQGAANINLPGGKKRRKRATDDELQLLQEILDEVLCDGIPTGSIVPGSCILRVLNYDDPPVCPYLLTFNILDENVLVEALNVVNENMEAKVANAKANTGGATATPGTIGEFSQVTAYHRSSILGDAGAHICEYSIHN